MSRLFVPVMWCALLVAALLGAAGLALGVAHMVREPAIEASAELAPLAARCPNCGRIESKRAVPSSKADPHGPRMIEYTVRMSDGSIRVFQDSRPGSWRLGERLMVIDGTGPL